MVFGKLLQKDDDEQSQKTFQYGNIDEKEINGMLNLIHAAQDCNASFDITFELSIGEFVVDAFQLNNIKSTKKTKNNDASIVINHSDAVMSNEVTIPLKHILGISIDISCFCRSSIDENVGVLDEYQ